MAVFASLYQGRLKGRLSRQATLGAVSPKLGKESSETLAAS